MTPALSPIDRQRFEAAEILARTGKTGQAIGAFRAFIEDRPDFAPAHYQLAVALQSSGDRPGAEAAFREALTIDPGLSNAAVRLAIILTARRESLAAIDLLAPFIGTPAADLPLLTAYAMALKAAGRMDDAIAMYQVAIDVAPSSGVAEHNLASALGDVHRLAEAEAAASRAFAKGLDAPETWLVRGRALQGLGDFDGAENAYRAALVRRPDYGDAHTDLAQLIWMRTEDSGGALEVLNASLSVSPDPRLSLAKARVLEYAGDITGAMSALEEPLSRREPDPQILITAAHLSLSTDPLAALDYAERAFAMVPGNGPAKTALCQVNLALGRADAAAAIASELRMEWPADQFPVALLGTAWRLLGDDRYRQLYDFGRLVRSYSIDAPAGWASLGAYLADLASELRALQRLQGHPIGQSLRNGVQTGQSLALSSNPVILAFFNVIDAPVRAYIGDLRKNEDGFGARARDDYRFSGAWSALLRPGGYHVNHLHPLGWISSAFHVELPPAVDQGHEGWLQFGEPGLPTQTPLPPEHLVKPNAGTLVLFPSYMWHGTVPFGGDKARLTIAFDILPK
jgi:tetratricopeptide (TPR) repeat protein